MIGNWNERNHKINKEFLRLYEVAFDYAQRNDLFLYVKIFPIDTERSELELTLLKFEPRAEITAPGQHQTYGADQVEGIFIPYTQPVAIFGLIFGSGLGVKLQAPSANQRETAVDFFKELDEKLGYSIDFPYFKLLIYDIATSISTKPKTHSLP